jgi:hypothetical protein
MGLQGDTHRVKSSAEAEEEELLESREAERTVKEKLSSNMAMVDVVVVCYGDKVKSPESECRGGQRDGQSRHDADMQVAVNRRVPQGWQEDGVS